VRSVTVSEPRWLPDDLAVALAARRAAREPRNGQGVPISQATDPALADRWHVPLPKRDNSLAKLRRTQEDRRKRYPDEDPSALLWRVQLKDQAPTAE
jgi:hypothetical protein